MKQPPKSLDVDKRTLGQNPLGLPVPSLHQQFLSLRAKCLNVIGHYHDC